MSTPNSAARKRAEEWAHHEQMAHIGEKYYQYSPPTIEAFMTMHGPLIVMWEHDDNPENKLPLAVDLL